VRVLAVLLVLPPGGAVDSGDPVDPLHAHPEWGVINTLICGLIRRPDWLIDPTLALTKG
jgi:hypothetical protein